jgi:uncharacterized membrane protein
VSIEEINRSLGIFVGRIVIAIGCFVVAGILVFSQTSNFIVHQYNGPSNGFYSGLYFAVVLISLGTSFIFQTGWKSRVTSGVVIYLMLILFAGGLFAGGDGFFECITKDTKTDAQCLREVFIPFAWD